MNSKNLYITYNNEKIEFELEKNKRKSICIIVKEQGEVIVRAPIRVSNIEILKFVESKNKWIYKKVLEQKSRFRKITFSENDELMILGKKYYLNIAYHEKKNSKVELQDDKILITISKDIEDQEVKDALEKAYNKYLFDIAKKEIPVIFNKMASIVNLYPKELKIRNFKRAWGNCSNKKIISINKNICKFNKSAIEYVCLHEICHLKYMNHSKDFWDMVKKYMPNYKEIEKQIK